MVAKIASIASLESISQLPAAAATETFGLSKVAAAIVVSNALARATAAPLVYACDYITDDEDAKGDFYNWFGESKRILGIFRVVFAVLSASMVAIACLPAEKVIYALITFALCTVISGLYGTSVIGGVIGDFLGATICMTEVAIYMSITGNFLDLDVYAFGRLLVVFSLPKVLGYLRRG